MIIYEMFDVACFCNRVQIVDDEVSKVILEIAKLMVDNGCDITKRNKNGFTPAMTALKMVREREGKRERVCVCVCGCVCACAPICIHSFVLMCLSPLIFQV